MAEPEVRELVLGVDDRLAAVSLHLNPGAHLRLESRPLLQAHLSLDKADACIADLGQLSCRVSYELDAQA